MSKYIFKKIGEWLRFVVMRESSRPDADMFYCCEVSFRAHRFLEDFRTCELFTSSENYRKKYR